jgi:hypothetical protein
LWRVWSGRQPFGDREPVRIREPDIQQHNIGPQARDRRDRCSAVGDVAGHGKAFRLQKRSCRLAKTLVVINDQQSRAHATIVTEINADRIVASTNASNPIHVPARARDWGLPRFRRP